MIVELCRLSFQNNPKQGFVPVVRELSRTEMVNDREPEYHKNTIKRLYKYIKPVKAEIDAFASKTEELASEYRSEKQ